MRRVKKGTRGDGPKNKASSKRMMSSGVSKKSAKTMKSRKKSVYVEKTNKIGFYKKGKK
jgi:hypothetical protein